MKAILLFLISCVGLCAAPINFQNITSTNVVKTNDALLINANFGGGVWSTRQASVEALKTTAGFQANIWTNSSGFIYPSGTTLSNTATFMVRQSDGSLFTGREVYRSVAITPTNHIYPLYAAYYTNQTSQVSLNLALVDDPDVFDKYAGIDLNLGSQVGVNPAATLSMSSGIGGVARNVILSADLDTIPIKYQVNFTDVFSVADDGAVLTPAVTLSGTTNQVIFGATNTAPSSSAAPTRWISVQVAGESAVYRLPLYE